ncbi:element excision factor XisI family protein [Spirosoma foliorum]|uniref:XisI protein n=1 Tax=Spirosoma foliorum TaxID=2710596 RepID=A0A7G5GY49_9BACT|nr:element excision factor XisI family protein [Spirosoma foliorum]QMW03791.1 XisI protein [Spirosoma foliorum]
MDAKIETYSLIIADWLTEFVKSRNNGSDTDYELVIDPVHRHFQVMRTEWYQGSFKFRVVFHFQIKPTGKVWLLVNNTDILVTDDLIERGIPASDIVIGFLPEAMRTYSGFAVA